MYLDDGIGIDTDEQLCHNIANEVKIDLIKSGFVSNAEKSLWQPVKRLVWLGTIIDTEYGYYKTGLRKLSILLQIFVHVYLCAKQYMLER